MPELASMAYRVLNAARSWRYLETGELGSKVEGAAWLERRDPDPDTALLDAALAYQRGGMTDRPDERTVNAFVERVEACSEARSPDLRRKASRLVAGYIGSCEELKFEVRSVGARLGTERIECGLSAHFLIS